MLKVRPRRTVPFSQSDSDKRVQAMNLKLFFLAVIFGSLSLTNADVGRTLQSVTTTNQTSQTSIPWYAPGGKGSEPIPLDDPRQAPTGAPTEQVLSGRQSVAHLAPSCTDASPQAALPKLLVVVRICNAKPKILESTMR